MLMIRRMAWIHENNDDDDNLEVLLQGSTKVPLFSKVNNRNSGSRTFSALLMLMMATPRIFWTRIMASMMMLKMMMLLSNKSSGHGRPLHFFTSVNHFLCPERFCPFLDLERAKFLHPSTENDNNLPSYTVHLS